MTTAKQIRGLPYVRSTPPTNPKLGDRWVETDSGGTPLYDWEWHYNSSAWLGSSSWISPPRWFTIFYKFSLEEQFNFFDTENFRIYIPTFRTKLLFDTPQNSSDYWVFELRKKVFLNDGTALASFNTQNQISDQFNFKTEATNIGIQPAATPLIQIYAYPASGSPGSITGTASFKYHYVR